MSEWIALLLGFAAASVVIGALMLGGVIGGKRG